jgi:hypothetical protein
MSSRGKMKLGIPVEIEINSLLVPLYQIVHFHKNIVTIILNDDDETSHDGRRKVVGRRPAAVRVKPLFLSFCQAVVCRATSIY